MGAEQEQVAAGRDRGDLAAGELDQRVAAIKADIAVERPAAPKPAAEPTSRVASAVEEPVRLIIPGVAPTWFARLAAVRVDAAESVPLKGPIWMVPSLVSVPPIVSVEPPSWESRSSAIVPLLVTAPGRRHRRAVVENEGPSTVVRPASALLELVSDASVTNAFAPLKFSLLLAAIVVIWPLANSISALPP